MSSEPFTDADLDQLGERGISLDEARRQLDLLNGPPRFVALERCCRPGDGIEAPDPERHGELLALHEGAARGGRCIKLVPASGAATRMFADLQKVRAEGSGILRSDLESRRAADDAAPGAVLAFLDDLEGFAFFEELRAEVARRGHDLGSLRREGRIEPILDALLSPRGLGFADRPKGLIPFHAYGDGGRTPFEEHLVEAAGYARDAADTCRLHFTVSAEHRDGFRDLLDRVGETWGRRLDVRFEVGFSLQHPATDTLAVDPDGKPFRDDDGRLLFRPAGHGALLRNLAELEGDIVFIKNIDNVVPDRSKEPTLHWKRLLCGHLVRLQNRIFAAVRELRDGLPAPERLREIAGFAAERLSLPPPGDLGAEAAREWLLDRLHRPLRVCGVVRNTGEPGGGPFWIRPSRSAGPLQIVEGAQVDTRSGEQREIFRSATHFNPVDLVCGVRDADGRPFDLPAFVDPDAVIVTRKTHGGRELRALERPGLWNGAMAGWHTVFVEVPAETFAPVKTVNDLLRPDHRSG